MPEKVRRREGRRKENVVWAGWSPFFTTYSLSGIQAEVEARMHEVYARWYSMGGPTAADA